LEVTFQLHDRIVWLSSAGLVYELLRCSSFQTIMSV